ncbi:TetR/AcrR family transcriptional regulator [Paenibacillus hamazuiensis]|uniref:TetR/AcrR family transcriptional regulator n=1 Tax=Paenibacillus hamazuiensis TaxID=2936508 RepID=UPI00200FF4B1|nr:TetR/AcrR family transcriptional regulator [Paenibacillus hamazuiensis]
MKRELKREQTLQLLLGSTEQLVREKGCAKTTLNDIMERSGLSKGAIFHYVKGKDELFALVLKSKIDDTNRRFFEVANQPQAGFEGPMKEIAGSFSKMEKSDEVANQIFRYMLGRSDEPVALDILREFYDYSVKISRHWIETGQQHGVIPTDIDTEKTAELFVLLSFGLRMRSGIAPENFAMTPEDLMKYMASTLQPNKKEGNR